jgi:hypothetical protein
MMIRDSFVVRVDYCICDDKCWPGPGHTAPTPSEYLIGEKPIEGLIS